MPKNAVGALADARPMIEARDVGKTFLVKRRGRGYLGALFSSGFDTMHALRDVSFDVEPGETVGIVGPNGAGKTTLIKLLVGLIQPTSGRILIDGKLPSEQRHQIGIAIGNTMLLHRMTGYDNLEYYGRLYGVRAFDERICELSDWLGLRPWMDEFVEHYSEGTKARLALARALIHDPAVLVLDEPTANLDVGVADEIHRIIHDLEKTVILTTHNVEEACLLSDRVVLLDGGRIAHTIENPQAVEVRRILIDESRKNLRNLQGRAAPKPPL
jgi:ABC-type multidrug transport system ATPase subunit